MRISTTQFQLNSLTSILDQQAKLSKTQQQLASGRRILTPSDDPAGSAAALELTSTIANFEQFKANAQQAKLRLSQEETVLGEAEVVLQRVRELTLQANNASQDSVSRKQIAAEVRERLDQLVQLANSSDGNGEYLFSGFQGRTQPFERVGGQVNYKGDQGQRMVQVGPARQAAGAHSGFQLFMAIKDGSGEYAAASNASNAGSGVILTPQVTDRAQAQSESYTIRFGQNTAGEKVYYVTDGAGDLVAPDPASVYPPPATAPSPLPLSPVPTVVLDGASVFEAGDTIEFDGISVAINGEPDATAGDSFTVRESENRSVFATLQSLVTALETSTDGTVGNATFNNAANRALEGIDRAHETLLDARAEIGARLHGIDAEIDSNDTAVLEMQKTLSSIEDLDYAEAISRLQLQLAGMQAAQQSYVKIQGLSLFNYL